MDKNTIIKITKILILLNILKNPVIFLLYNIDIKLFNFFYKFNKKNNKISYWLFIIISNIYINPIKLVLGYFYNLIEKWKNLNFIDLLFKRLEGLILSILIFTDIYNLILSYTYWYIYIYTLSILICIFF